MLLKAGFGILHETFSAVGNLDADVDIYVYVCTWKLATAAALGT
jgi:hypothetical protein